MRTGIKNRPTLRDAEAACASRSVAAFLRSASVRALAAPSTFTPSRTRATTARRLAWSLRSSVWLQWLVLDRCFGLALLLCTHSMHLQRAGMISRRAAMLSPLSHTCRRLPQALAAQRVHGQMADPNSRAASAQCSRSMESASMVRVDVPAGSRTHAYAPQSGRNAHPCVRSPHRAEPDRQMDRNFDSPYTDT